MYKNSCLGIVFLGMLCGAILMSGCPTVPLTVFIDEPVDQFTVEKGKTVRLRGRILGGPISSVTWSVDGETISEVLRPGSGNTTTTLDTGGLDVGSHTILLTARTGIVPTTASITINVVAEQEPGMASSFQAALNSDEVQYRLGAGTTVVSNDGTFLHVAGGNEISLEGSADAIRFVVFDDSGAVFEEFTVAGSGVRTAAAGSLADGSAAFIGTNGGDIQLNIYTPGSGVETFEIPSALYHEAFGLSVLSPDDKATDDRLLVAGSGSGIGASGEAYLAILDRTAMVLQEWRYGGDDYDAFYDASLTSDGGYVAAGVSESSERGDDDMYLVKTDGAGNVAFEARFGNSVDDEEARGVIELSDGFLIAGTRHPDALGDPNTILVIRTDSEGAIVWEESFGATAPSDVAEAYRMLPQDSGALIAGARQNGGSLDVYLLEIDLDGNVVDEKYYGGTRNDRALSLSASPDGGYLIAGYSNSFGDPFVEGGYLIKTDEMRDSPQGPE